MVVSKIVIINFHTKVLSNGMYVYKRTACAVGKCKSLKISYELKV